jgi:death on curing protein
VKSPKIKFITVTRVLAIHNYAVKRYGGSQGIRDLGLVESAVARPQSGFGGEYLYTNIFDMAAALLQSLLKNHPFVDGNKRTALFSTGIFLKLNGFRLINNGKDEVEFAVRVDNSNLTLEEISAWLKENCQKS